MRHTKGRWECDGMAVFCGDNDIALCAHYDKPLDQAESDARRIVACVNACDGIANPSKLQKLLLECLALESCRSVDWEEHVMYVSRAFRDLVGDDFGMMGDA